MPDGVLRLLRRRCGAGCGGGAGGGAAPEAGACALLRRLVRACWTCCGGGRRAPGPAAAAWACGSGGEVPALSAPATCGGAARAAASPEAVSARPAAVAGLLRRLELLRLARPDAAAAAAGLRPSALGRTRRLRRGLLRRRCGAVFGLVRRGREPADGRSSPGRCSACGGRGASPGFGGSGRWAPRVSAPDQASVRFGSRNSAQPCCGSARLALVRPVRLAGLGGVGLRRLRALALDRRRCRATARLERRQVGLCARSLAHSEPARSAAWAWSSRSSVPARCAAARRAADAPAPARR